ncbi:UNVERIFIED_CONTAM: hypothetical protein QE387_000186 [Pseudacidovorax intermedius]|nr:hypothetical protein [Pseudacidovorax intermedius]
MMMAPKGKLLIIGGKEDRHGSSLEIEHNNHNFSPHEILRFLTESESENLKVHILTDNYTYNLKTGASRGAESKNC